MKDIIFVLVILIEIVLSGTIPRPLNSHGDHQLPHHNTIKYQPRVKAELESSYWLNNAQHFVQSQLNKKQNKNVAKNIVMFMGDGMSMTTLAATRPYIGGVDMSLSFEDFPAVGMTKTYCVDYQVPDSGCTGTAYLSGVKGNYGTIGLTATVARFDCTKQLDESTHTPSLAKWAMDAGKVAGMVTTSRVTDASPASVFAHSADRYWENDVEIRNRCGPNNLQDITKQLVRNEVGRNLRVILGGGRREFRNTTAIDEENDHGYRSDGLDLIQEWIQLKRNENASYVWNLQDLLAVNADNVDYLLGLFEADHMKYHLDVLSEQVAHTEPTLSQMTEKAIEILSKHENGFFLFVEGARIDSAHHGTLARLALDETAELSKAVDVARRMLSDEDTLIVVTADHSHTLTYSGYPVRWNDIFGMADDGTWTLDGMPYMTLGYSTGDGFINHINATDGTRINPAKINTSGNHFQFPAALPSFSETHGGDDTAVFASGPWAHLFSGNYEQTVVPYLMAYAACVGEGITVCD